MKRSLRVPAALAFTLLSGTAVVAGVAALPSCGGGESTPDAVTDGFPVCETYCIPDDTDAGVCPEPTQCVDDMGNCPAGCRPVG